MSDIKWIDKENYSHFSNKNWICSIYKNNNEWSWIIRNENFYIDDMNQPYYGVAFSRKQAKIFCEEIIKSK